MLERNNFIFLFALFLIIISCKDKIAEKKELKKIVSNCNYLNRKDSLYMFFKTLESDFYIDMAEDNDYKRFTYFFDNVHKYKNTAIRMIECDSININQKGHLIYILNGLSTNEYFCFLKKESNNFFEKKIDEKLMMKIVYSSFGNKDHIIKNYKNKVIFEILYSLRKSPSISKENKDYLDFILEGGKWKEKKAMYKRRGWDFEKPKKIELKDCNSNG